VKRQLANALAATGVVSLVYAFELRTWHGRGTWTGDPKGKVLIASWLASELWLNLLLLAVGLVALGFGGALLLRDRHRSGAR